MVKVSPTTSYRSLSTGKGSVSECTRAYACIHFCIHPLFRSFSHSLTRSLSRTLTFSHSYSLSHVRVLSYPLVYVLPLAYALTQSFTLSLFHPLTHSPPRHCSSSATVVTAPSQTVVTPIAAKLGLPLSAGNGGAPEESRRFTHSSLCSFALLIFLSYFHPLSWPKLSILVKRISVNQLLVRSLVYWHSLVHARPLIHLHCQSFTCAKFTYTVNHLRVLNLYPTVSVSHCTGTPHTHPHSSVNSKLCHPHAFSDYSHT